MGKYSDSNVHLRNKNHSNIIGINFYCLSQLNRPFTGQVQGFSTTVRSIQPKLSFGNWVFIILCCISCMSMSGIFKQQILILKVPLLHW